MAPEPTLAADFAEPTREQWLAAVATALKGGDFEKLVTTTYDGIRIEPLYTGDGAIPDAAGFPGFDPWLRGAQAPPRPDGRWDIRTRTVHPDIATANSQLLQDLAGGATSVEVLLDCGGGVGVSIRSADDLARLLDGVVLEAAPVSLRAGRHAATVARWFTELAGEAASGELGVDPVAALVTAGEAEADLAALAALAAAGPRLFLASSAPASDAGASEAQEIGYVLGTATAYLRALVESGTADPAARVTLEITADVDIFATVAKLRALRHCWATVLQHLGLSPSSTRIVAVSADRWLTEVDPWVNLLRGTAATLGAVLGGADTVTLAPFDSAAGLPGDLGRRMARNTQLILQDESAIGRVTDPLGGSWYVEQLTDDLARAGWRYFQRIEQAGGIFSALEMVRADIETVAQRRARDIATRTRPITGVSEFPLLDEQRPDPVPAPEPDPRPALPICATHRADPWPRLRLAAPYERLRARAEGATIYLATLGSPAVHTARATFAANLFAAGGIRAVMGSGLTDPAEVASEFAAAGAPIACICSSDQVYEQLAAPVAQALKRAGARRVYLAGRGDYEGVDETVGLGVDVLDVLSRAEVLR